MLNYRFAMILSALLILGPGVTSVEAAARRSKGRSAKRKKWKGKLPPLKVPAEIKDTVVELPPQDEPYVLAEGTNIVNGTLSIWPGARIANGGAGVTINVVGEEGKLLVEGDPDDPPEMFFSLISSGKMLPATVEMRNIHFRPFFVVYSGHMHLVDCTVRVSGTSCQLVKWPTGMDQTTPELCPKRVFENCVFQQYALTVMNGWRSLKIVWDLNEPLDAFRFRDCAFHDYILADPRFLLMTENCDFYGDKVFTENFFGPMDMKISGKETIKVYLDEPSQRKAVEQFFEKSIPKDMAKKLRIKVYDKPLTDYEPGKEDKK